MVNNKTIRNIKAVLGVVALSTASCVGGSTVGTIINNHARNNNVDHYSCLDYDNCFQREKEKRGISDSDIMAEKNKEYLSELDKLGLLKYCKFK